jgi:hypothetical protein
METRRTHLALSLFQLSPFPKGRMLGHMSRATSCPALRAWNAAHGGESLASQSTKSHTAARKLWLAFPNLNSYCCMACASDPPGPALPDRRQATFSTISLVTSRSIKSVLFHTPPIWKRLELDHPDALTSVRQ